MKPKNCLTCIITLLFTIILNSCFAQRPGIDSFYRTGIWWYSADPPQASARYFLPADKFIPPPRDCGKKEKGFVFRIENDHCKPLTQQTIWLTKQPNYTEFWIDISNAYKKQIPIKDSVDFDKCYIYCKQKSIPIVTKSAVTGGYGQFMWNNRQPMFFIAGTDSISTYSLDTLHVKPGIIK